MRVKNKLEDNIRYMLLRSINMCEANGRKPLLIIVNNKHFISLSTGRGAFRLTGKCIKHGNLNEYFHMLFGIPVIFSSHVKDFYIVDDRHWYEQEW